jgi:predicted dehydrogenase
MPTSESVELRVAVLGCGQIADAHLQEIGKLSNATIVAVCDREPDLAYQAGARFGVPSQYTDVDEMLADARPDVVHITTPPHTHSYLATKCIHKGAHVYVEKPLALDALETRQLLATAVTNGRLVCVGHDHLFDPIWKDCLSEISAGRLGTIGHVDSQQGYDPSGPFGRLIQTDPHHWIHRLPGGIIQNVISHAVCKVTPFLVVEYPEVTAVTCDTDERSQLPTELRVALKGASVTANITLLSKVKPVQRIVRIYGNRSGMEVDFDSGILRTIRAPHMPGAFGRIEIAVGQASEALKNTTRTVGRFLRSDLHYFAGMRNLFDAFYTAIRANAAPPISYDEIQRVANIMDLIFERARCGSAQPQIAHRNGENIERQH